jgi:fucose 4-O-acetylase-like acetyltransferase
MLRAVAYRTPEIGMHTQPERGDTVKEDYVDGAQGIAIIAVVCATVLGRIEDAGFLQDGRVAHLLLLLQYTVCVFGYPCFFFLFGLKAADALRHANSRWAFAKMTISALVYPYLLWSLLQMGVQWIVAQQANHPFPIDQLARVIWAPVDQFWFLYALCICQLIAFVTVRRTSRDTWGIAGTVAAVFLVIVAALCATLATRTDWGIVTLTLWGLTFFLAGIVLGPRFSEWIARAARVPLLLAAVVIFAVTIKVGQSLGGYLNASALPASFAGILATMLIARQLAGRWRVRWLTALGAAWMPVYLLHYLVTAAVWNGLLAAFVTSPPAQFVLGAIAGLVIPVGIYRLTRRLRIAAPAGFDLVDLAQRTEARQVELAHYRARIGIE